MNKLIILSIIILFPFKAFAVCNADTTFDATVSVDIPKPKGFFSGTPKPSPEVIVEGITKAKQSVLQKFIPDSIGQFLSDDAPEVVVDGARTDLLEHIRRILINLTSGEIFDNTTGQYVPNIQVLNLFEYDGYNITRIVGRLVMTNVTFKETPETGYGLYCDFSFEQVTFVTLKQTTIPQDVQSSLKKKASSKSAKGRQDSTIQDASSNSKVESSPDLDPARGAVANG